MATHTLTLDTTGLKYIDINGISHDLKDTSQTIAFTFTDTGTGGNYIGVEDNARLSFLDGGSVDVECDPTYSFDTTIDAATGANVECGVITFVEKNNTRHHYKLSSFTITDADGTGANNITTMTLESKERPMQTMTWTNINTA